MAIHVGFTVWAWRLVPVVAVPMALASLQSALFHRRAAVVWLLLGLLLAGYAAFLAWGPSVASAGGLRAQVVAQKTATGLLALALLYVAYEADRARDSLRAQ